MKKTKQLRMLLVAVMLAVSGSVFAQVKIGSNPTVITSTSNLEVEGTVGGDISKMAVTKDSSKVGIGTASPTNKLHVKSAANPVRLEGLVSGTGNETVLTVDANGVVKKQPSTVPVPTVRLTVGLAASYDATSNAQYRTIPLTVVGSTDGNFSTATYLYTVPTTGVYQISGVYDGTAVTSNTALSIVLYAKININTFIKLNGISEVTFPNSPAVNVTRLSGIATIKLNAGDTVGLATQSCGTGCPQTYTAIPGFTNLTIMKLD